MTRDFMVGNSKLLLSGAPVVRTALLEAVQGVAAYAQSQVENPDHESAVHEFRKSLRRLRSATRWVQDSRRDIDFKPLRNALREVFQITNPLRDADVIDAIAKSVRDLAPPREFERLFPQESSPNPIDVFGVLSRAASQLKGLVQQFEELLPHDLSVGDLEEGTRRLYRRCRRRRKAAIRDPIPATLHDFRKRTKELRYVVEAIASANTLAEPLEADLGLLAKRLGRVTDLELLMSYLGVETIWAVAVQEIMSSEFENAVKESGHLFASSPAEFAYSLFLVPQGRWGTQ